MHQSEHDEDVFEHPDGFIELFVNAGNTITLVVKQDDPEVPVVLSVDEARQIAARLIRLADAVDAQEET